jgi:hypothetical protein
MAFESKTIQRLRRSVDGAGADGTVTSRSVEGSSMPQDKSQLTGGRIGKGKSMTLAGGSLGSKGKYGALRGSMGSSGVGKSPYNSQTTNVKPGQANTTREKLGGAESDIP